MLLAVRHRYNNGADNVAHECRCRCELPIVILHLLTVRRQRAVGGRKAWHLAWAFLCGTAGKHASPNI